MPEDEELDVAGGEAWGRARERRRAIQEMGRLLVPKLEQYQRIQAMYASDNATLRRALGEITELLASSAVEEDAVALVISGVNAFINGTRLKLDRSTSESVVKLAERLDDYGLGGLTFLQGIRGESIAAFYRLLDEVEPGDQARVALAERLLQQRVSDLTLIPPRRVATAASATGDGTGGGVDGGLDRGRCVENYTTGLLSLGIGGFQGLGGAVRRRRQARVVRNLIDLGERNTSNVLNLSSIRTGQWMGANHVMNVTVLAISVGMRLGLTRRHLLRLGLCTMYHNTGEDELPQGLLDKEGILSEDERELMQAHPVLGFSSLLQQYGFNVHTLERALISLEHHQNFDLTGGYPPLRRGELHLFSRIISVCDSFDALLAERPHRPAFPPDQAVKMIARKAGTQYDPVVVTVLISLVGLYPPGSLVELSTGEIAVVYGVGEGKTPMKRPKVVLIRDYLGGEVTPRLVDLHEQIPGRRAFKRTIVRPLDPLDHDLQPSGYLFHPDLAGADGGAAAEDDERHSEAPERPDDSFEIEIEE